MELQWELPSSKTSKEELSKLIDQELSIENYQKILAHFGELGAYVSCRLAQNTNDEEAALLEGVLSELSAKFEKKRIPFLYSLDLDTLSYPIRPMIEREVNFLHQMLPPEYESVIASLIPDGYAGIEQFYFTLVGSLKFPYEGEEVPFSYVEQKLFSSDREIRKKAFASIQTTTQKHLDLFVKLYNNLIGFRLKLYQERKWDNPFHEALHTFALSKDSLKALFEGIKENKTALASLLAYIKKELHLEPFEWHDQYASAASNESIPPQVGVERLEKYLKSYMPGIAKIAKQMALNRWINFEKGEQKRGGAFSTDFPLSNEIRIHINYDDNDSSLETLFHEVGHGVHSYLLKDLSAMERNYPMTLAETASTFFERILLEHQSSKLPFLLRTVSYLMNLPCRFYFEEKVYKERSGEPLTKARLLALMEEAQKEAFGDELDLPFPEFFALKMHFYLASSPSYNFPYIVGFLFSNFIFNELKQNKGTFEARYKIFLRDTGILTCEEIMKKHFGVDITKKAFWSKVVADLIRL